MSNCRDCKHAKWKKDSRGHRMIADQPGECTVELAPAPKCIRDGLHFGPPKKGHILADTDDRPCDLFEKL